jgi:hypothetical protein
MTTWVLLADYKQFIAAHCPTSLTNRLASVEGVADMDVYVCSPRPPRPPAPRHEMDGGAVRSIA